MDLVVGASSNAVKSLVGKLGSLLAQEYILIRGVSDDVQYINDELASMQAFLHRTSQASSHNEQSQDWMKQVREVSYDIEDCIDDVNHRLGDEPRGNGKLMYLRKKWYLFTTLRARRCIAAEIRNLKVRAQHVSDRRIRYAVVDNSNNEGATDRQARGPVDRQHPAPQLIGTKQPVGVEGAIQELSQWFINGREITDKRFLAIFGFGGIGKTTLAMELYRKVGDDFHCRAFVQASQKFSLLMLLKNLIEQFHEQQTGASQDSLEGMEEWDKQQLKRKLAVQLRDKRYLILIDDIWSVSAWESINDSLPEISKGGTIVVTTRFRSVAAACSRQNGLLYDHKQLNDDDSYKLFRQIISIAPDNPSRNTKDLLKKCGGLPLAVIVVTGLVASKLRSGPKYTQLDEHLLKVSLALGGDLETQLKTEGVTEVLNQCYNDVPADLKTCLLYLSMFPKGCLISRKRLIRRWIAEGFIIEKHGKIAEEVAEDYFNELISRNLIRAVNNSSNGKVKNYQIHDMVLEFIVSKSSDENLVTIVGGHWQIPFPSYKVRRLSVHRSAEEEIQTVERMNLSHVRSLTAFERFEALSSSFPKFRILQVLDLECCRDLSPRQLKKICKMHQLKYLSLRRTDIEEVPSEIGKLEKLEVLDIRETKVRRLPPSVERLKRMTHLLSGNKSKGGALILTEEITKMTALQTLSGMGIFGSSTTEMVGSSSTSTSGAAGANTLTTGIREEGGSSRRWQFQAASSGSCKEVLRALEKLTNLKKLSIYILGKLEETDESLLLSAIEHLSSCSLKFLAIGDDFTGFLDNSLISSEAPPEHLHTLELSGMLSQVPVWIGRLHSLEKLTLSLTSLRTDALQLVSELTELFSLTFCLDAMSNNSTALSILHENTLGSEGEIFVPVGGFRKLTLLRLLAPVLPPVSFLKGSMPAVQRLEMKFRIADCVRGLENLGKLQQVFLAVSSRAPRAADRIRQMIQNPLVVVIVEEYNAVEQ